MKKIFLVWGGEYSSSYVFCAYTDKGVADQVASQIHAGRVEECELDPDDTRDWLERPKMWFAKFAADSSLLSVEPAESDWGEEHNWRNHSPSSFSAVFRIFFKAVDRESATKDAPTHLAQWLAKKNQ